MPPRRRECDTTPLWGAALVLVTVSWGTAMLCVRSRRLATRQRVVGGTGAPDSPPASHSFAVLGAKLLPPTGNAILDFLREDWYYPLLAVMCIPTTLVAVYLNWLGMKFFRHTGGRGGT